MIAVSVPLMIIFTVLLLVPFYNGDVLSWCPWCKYLSCIPGACDISQVK